MSLVMAIAVDAAPKLDMDRSRTGAQFANGAAQFFNTSTLRGATPVAGNIPPGCRPNLAAIAAHKLQMRNKLLLIAILFSLNLWVVTFDVTRAGYHEAQAVGLMPNLHVDRRFHRLF